MIEEIKRITAIEKRLDRVETVESVSITNSTPASAGATGVKGQIAWDASYIYVCTATDTWKRVAIATWP